MLRSALAGLACLVVAAATSCSSVGGPVVESGARELTAASTPASTAPPSIQPTRLMTAESAASSIGYAVPRVRGLVTFTVRNDPQRLLGRPDGYVSAIVVIDDRLTCETLGVSCGAEIEQWPNPAAARHRSAFQPLLVREFHYRYGSVLIRVSGALGPAAALEYDRALWQR